MSYPISLHFLGFGEYSINANTLKLMEAAIKSSAKNWEIRETAATIIANVPEKDYYGEVQAIYDWVRQRYRYVKDPAGTELLQSPLVALDYWQRGKVWQGDCDDITILLLSLYKSIGHEVGMRIASYKPDKKFGHVYGIVRLYGVWYPVDGIAGPEGKVGWEHGGITATRDWLVK